MIRGRRTEDRRQRFCSGFAAQISEKRRVAAHNHQSSVLCPPSSERGFTLVEMVMVIVITGIIGGIVAVFLQSPVQQYMDVARRADITDIADTALRRIGRDLRLALPNSVRVRNAAGTPCANPSAACYLEFLPAPSGGRYRAGLGGTDDFLDFDAADNSFEVLGTMPTVALGNFIVVYNMTADPADPNPNAYTGGNRTDYTGAVPPILSFAAKQFPSDSPSHRFHVITTPVTYVCAPGAGGTGTLTRWQGYDIQAAQPIALPATGTPTAALLANSVSACSFTYDANVVAQRSGLVTMNLAITRDGETVTLYSATHVSNQP